MIPEIKQWVEGQDVDFGVWSGQSNAHYHGGPGISKSGLDDIAVSPLYYQTVKLNPKPSTDALEIGTAFHTIVLEPEKFELEYMCMPDGAPKRPSDRERYAKKPSPDTIYRCQWWDDFEAANKGKKVLSNKNDPDKGIWGRDDWDTLHFMAAAIRAHPEASVLLNPEMGKAELSIYVSKEIYGHEGKRRLVRCRPDFTNFDFGAQIDLKSARDATLSGFQRATHDHRYDVQHAWYHDLSVEAGMFNTSFFFVACEKLPPFHVGVYELEPNWVREGRLKYQRDLRIYHECLESDLWPSIPDFTRVLPQPGYARWNPVS